MAATTTYGSIAHDRRELELESNEKDKQSSSKTKLTTWKVVAPIVVILFAVLAFVSQTSRHSAANGLQVKAATETFPAHFFNKQLVDHHDSHRSETYSQRYFEKKDYFGGPGSPIFVILGGEDPLDGLLYPFVYENLARDFQGYTAALEHRFYGESTPVDNPTHADLHQLLSPNQATYDAARFIQHKRKELGCSLDRSSKYYCPAISVGGSYPGFLSSLMRFVHSDVVDIR
jgi:Serine carboxypeptidase S28